VIEPPGEVILGRTIGGGVGSDEDVLRGAGLGGVDDTDELVLEVDTEGSLGVEIFGVVLVAFAVGILGILGTVDDNGLVDGV